jgi:hypothetical protein
LAQPKPRSLRERVGKLTPSREPATDLPIQLPEQTVRKPRRDGPDQSQPRYAPAKAACKINA